MPAFRRTLARLLPPGLTLAVAALLAVACGGGGGGSPTPSLPALEFSPVPEDVEVDLSRADQLYYEGAYEEALVIYTAAAQTGTDAEKQAGLWAIARIQSERGDNSAAERTVEAFRASDPDEAADRQALLLLGYAEYAQGDFDEAKEAFEEYVAKGGAAWPYAVLYLARIAADEGETDDAVDQIGEALLADLPPASAYEALLALADIQSKAGRTALALDAYRRAVAAAPTEGGAAEALEMLAGAANSGGDRLAAQDALEDLVFQYPATEQALEALDNELLSSNPGVTTRERAIVLFLHRANGEAGTAFQAVVDSGSGAAPEAHYYLGILAERAGAWDEAIAQYDAAINGLPPGTNDSLRAQAIWDRATVLERTGLTFDAIEGFATVSDASPTHEQAGEGMFRAGLLSYLAGRTDDALFYWTRMIEIVPNTEEQARANFWLSQAAAYSGDVESEVVYLQAAADADPLDYYGMRAQAILNGDVAPDALTVSAPTPDWANVETWLAGWAGAEEAGATEDLFAGEPWLRADELFEAGLSDRADDEFRDLLSDNAGNPWLTYRLLRRISDYGRPWVTSPAATALLTTDAPPEILQLVYPLEYLGLVQAEASANGFSPLLLLALMRQESLYDPGAISVAEAMGLTQVIPSTADGIAAELGETEFTYADLLRPRVSIRFGAYYLGTLLTGFGGTISPALAGYNGGPGNAGAWWDAAGGDPDLFLEVIEFPETRAYEELVLENYARYLYAYGFTDAPSLALVPGE